MAKKTITAVGSLITAWFAWETEEGKKRGAWAKEVKDLIKSYGGGEKGKEKAKDEAYSAYWEQVRKARNLAKDEKLPKVTELNEVEARVGNRIRKAFSRAGKSGEVMFRVIIADSAKSEDFTAVFDKLGDKGCARLRKELKAHKKAKATK